MMHCGTSRPTYPGAVALSLVLLAAGAVAFQAAHAAPNRRPATPDSCHACLRASDLRECHLVALELAQQDRLARAISIEARIHERLPMDAEIAAALGRMYHMARNKPRAIEMYHASLYASSGYPPALIGLGTIMEEQGEMAIAARYFGRAVRENPEEPLYKIRLARVMVQDGRGGEAIPLLEEIVQRWPGTTEAASAEKLMSRTALAKP
jgi:tetratricopeptide (TPR) repeat protein